MNIEDNIAAFFWTLSILHSLPFLCFVMLFSTALCVLLEFQEGNDFRFFVFQGYFHSIYLFQTG